MKGIKRFLTMTTLVLASTAAFAQFGSLGGLVGSSSGGGSASPESLVSGYVKGQGLVLKGQQSMIKALDLKTEGAKRVLEAKALSSTPTKSDVEEAKTVVEEGNAILSDAMQKNAGKMTEASKKEFSNGVGFLALGLREYVSVGAMAKNVNISPTSMGSSAVAAATIAPSLPSSIQTLSTTLKASVTFMQENKMPPLEKNATAGLPGF